MQLKDWVVADAIMEATEAWARERVSSIDTSTEENLTRYTLLHQEFEAWMDAKLEKWAINEGSSGDELHEALKEVFRLAAPYVWGI